MHCDGSSFSRTRYCSDSLNDFVLKKTGLMNFESLWLD
jgi:hypothetical protein